MITAEQIDLWRTSESEQPGLEFKEARRTFDSRKLCRYCVALANEGGGHLVLGIADKRPRQVVGTAAIQSPTSKAEDLFQKLGFRVDVEEVEHPDGRVVVFAIPPRPRGTAYHLDGRYLMRSGGSLVSMSEDQLRTIFAEGEPDWLEELSKVRLSASSVVQLLDTQAYFDLLNQPYPSSQERVLEGLVNGGLVDAEEDSFSIRRRGALLLAKRLSDFPDIARKAPRVVVYSDRSKLETRLDRVGDKGYAAGFQGLLDFVMTQLPRNEVIRDALREEITLVPEDVVRELLANALIHQDFGVTGASVMVEIFSDRIEVSNPGEPVVPVDRFIDGYQSRNERLADVMRRMGICEEKGSGIDRVVWTVEAMQLPAPEFRGEYQRTVVVVYGPRDFSAMNKEERVRACYQHCALKWVMSERMTNASLRKRFELGNDKTATISQVISATIEAGLVQQDPSTGSSRRFAQYLPWWA